MTYIPIPNVWVGKMWAGKKYVIFLLFPQGNTFCLAPDAFLISLHMSDLHMQLQYVH